MFACTWNDCGCRCGEKEEEEEEENQFGFCAVLWVGTLEVLEVTLHRAAGWG